MAFTRGRDTGEERGIVRRCEALAYGFSYFYHVSSSNEDLESEPKQQSMVKGWDSFAMAFFFVLIIYARFCLLLVALLTRARFTLHFVIRKAHRQGDVFCLAMSIRRP